MTIKTLQESLDYCVKTFPYFQWVPGFDSNDDNYCLYGIAYVPVNPESLKITIEVEQIGDVRITSSVYFNGLRVVRSHQHKSKKLMDALVPVKHFMESFSKTVEIIND